METSNRNQISEFKVRCERCGIIMKKNLVSKSF
jgi:hypothetical protein